MTTTTVSFHPHATLEWLEDVSAIRVKWERLFMTEARFYEICAAAFEIVAENKSKIWIADQYDSTSVFPEAVQKVITGDGLEKAALSAGLDMVLTVLPKNSGMSSLNAKKWTEGVKARKSGLILREFATLDDCKDWIQSQR